MLRLRSISNLRGFSSKSRSSVPSSEQEKAHAFADTRSFPSQSRVVIIGGGVIGTSVAYHLAKLGWRDVVLLEQGRLSCGTSWHAAGLIGQLRGTKSETLMSGVYGSKLYAQLEAETGHGTGFRQVGSLTVARTDDRLALLKRNASRAKAFGIEAHIVSSEESGKLWPYMRTDDLKGALWLPGDGTATSSDLVASLAAGAKQGGVRIFEETQVTGIEVTQGKVKSVKTSKGQIQCEVIVNCGGQWARKIGSMAGVSVPLHSAEHFYIVSKPLKPPVPPTLPVLRDPDAYIYYREWSGGLLMGGFEPKCKPCFTDGIPDKFEFSLLPNDWDHFSILMEGAIQRTPILETTEVNMTNGPESFTPDNQYILGESPEVRKFYVAAGFNSSGIASAGGAGRALSEWIVNDRPSDDLWSVDIRRFGNFHANINFLKERTFETLGLHYQIPWPRRELVSGRPLRCSPLYPLLRGKNACFGSKFGWERPNWFAPSGVKPEVVFSWGQPNWLPYVAQEHLACRNDVAIFDVSSFAKFRLSGPDVESFLQRICANDMSVADGKIVYTALLNEDGGIESDCTITRLSRNEYLIVTSTAQATRDQSWITRQLRPEENVRLTDVSSQFAVLSVMGPKSRALLSCLTSHDFSNEKFPFGTSQEVSLGRTQVLAQRITYVGELGWELYIPVENAIAVYEELHRSAISSEIPLRDGGYYAIDSLRTEKGYRAWGLDLSVKTTPLEAGLGFAVSFQKKTDFIGKRALLKQKKDGVKKRLTTFVFDDSKAYPFGDEPIFRNGELVGHVTTANFGHSIGRAVCLGYVSKLDQAGEPQVIDRSFVLGTDVHKPKYDIEIDGKIYSVKVSLEPSYDPKSLRVKS